jgi:hypothetical protein
VPDATECTPWSTCAPGEGVREDGDITRDLTCGACPEGTFVFVDDGLPFCEPFSSCRAGEYIVSEGTATSDRECAPCAGGFSDGLDAESCTPFTECPAGTFVAVRGSATRDRVCQACAPGETSAGPNTASESGCTMRRHDALSVGPTHACVVRDDGAVSCWGDGADGETTPPAGLVARDVAAGTSHTCALGAPASVAVCFGDDAAGQVSGAPADPIDAIASGRGFSCALRSADGGVTCWGDDSGGAVGAAPAGAFGALSARGGVACAIGASDAMVRCWGDDATGQVSGAPAVALESVAVGSDHVCGVRVSDRGLECWGADGSGQSTQRPAGAFSSVAAGDGFACAVGEASGQLECWGRDLAGEVTSAPGVGVSVAGLGQAYGCALRDEDGQVVCWGDHASRRTEGPPGVQAFDAITLGFDQACAVRSSDQRLFCWGYDVAGQSSGPSGEQTAGVSAATRSVCAIEPGVGVRCWGTTPATRIAEDAPTGSYDAVALGRFAACARSTDGTLECWGDDMLGRISGAPTEPVLAISSADESMCAILAADGALRCWGSTTRLGTPPAGGGFVSLDSNDGFGCAVDGAGSVACWGDDTHGQVSNARSAPMSKIAVGAGHVCGIKSADRRLVCWGLNNFDQADPPGGEFRDVFARGTTSCAIRATDGKTVCWGSTGDYVMSGAPNTREYLAVDGYCRIRAGDDVLECDRATTFQKGTRARSVDATRSMCAITTEGEVVCAGWDDFGQVAATPGGDGWIEVATGQYHACARRDTGEVYCWGRNREGQVTPRVQEVDATRNPGPGALTAGDLFSCALVGPQNQPWCWGADENDIETEPMVEMSFVKASHPTGFLEQDWACGLTQADRTPVCWGNADNIGTPPSGVSFETIDVGSRQACGVRSDDQKIECWGRAAGALDLPDSTYSAVSVDDAVCALDANTRRVHCVGSRLWNPTW